jgi:hypothetical protein
MVTRTSFQYHNKGGFAGFDVKVSIEKRGLGAPLKYDVTVFVIAKIRVKSTHPTRRA